MKSYNIRLVTYHISEIKTEEAYIRKVEREAERMEKEHIPSLVEIEIVKSHYEEKRELRTIKLMWIMVLLIVVGFYCFERREEILKLICK
jgi:hypothetical protein